jgi:hypothetical protein
VEAVTLGVEWGGGNGRRRQDSEVPRPDLTM